jgi:HSP20 family protein
MSRLPMRRDDADRSWFVEPFNELYRLTQEMHAALSRWSRFGPAAGWTVPAADLEETEDAYTVEVELPGVRKEDVTIDVEGRELFIRAERKERERQGRLRRRSITTGLIQYELTLPGDVEAEHAEAHLADGMLTVKLPKAKDSRGRRIPVH